MINATLSRKEVKNRLKASDYVLKKMLADANCKEVLQRPNQRIFPIKAWKPLFDFVGLEIENS